MKRNAYIIRFIHFIVSLYLLSCIVFLYVSIFIRHESKILYIAIISLLMEGLIVFLNRANCPLGILHAKYGDSKTFFELFLPKKFAENIIPIAAVISTFGLVLYFLQRVF